MTGRGRELIMEGILDAAIDCLLEYGADDLQITQIAARADVSTRTLNRYYPQKEALLAEAASKYLWGVYAGFADRYEAAAKEQLNGREKISLFLKLQKDYYKTHTIEAMMMVDMRFYRMRHSESADAFSLRGSSRIREIIIGCVEEGIRDGSVRPDIDPALVSALISASYNGVMQRLTMLYHSCMSDEFKQKFSGIFDSYIDMLERYLK